MALNPAIDLSLTAEREALRVAAENRGGQDLRLWARNNSWGWPIFSLLLAPPGSDEWREATARSVRWTRNVPRALELPAGGRLEYELRREDPGWEGPPEVEGWLSRPLRVRVRLRITATPEASEQGVFVGEALSPPSLSEPPHSWLAYHPL